MFSFLRKKQEITWTEYPLDNFKVYGENADGSKIHIGIKCPQCRSFHEFTTNSLFICVESKSYVEIKDNKISIGYPCAKSFLS